MLLLLAVLVLLPAGGLVSLLVQKSDRWAGRIGAGSAVIASILGGVPVLQMLLGGGTIVLRRPWSMPWGEFHLALDPLAAFFLLPTLVLAALGALYGAGYLQTWSGRRRLGAPWFFYNLLVASMVLVFVARNGVLFLVAWEIMSLASYFLVTFEGDKDSVRRAGWTYLVAMHIGTAFLLALFTVMSGGRETLDFGHLPGVLAGSPALAGLLFGLGLVGFGTKAGFMPLHLWLPEAHPAAPSHVSALMSGAMIKTGLYGLLRLVTLLGPPPLWWAWILIGIGAGSAVLGVLSALAQEDMKRLLAYSSVENVGLITLGIGLGLLGAASGMPALALLGLAGALLHILNHALIKGLLFLGAGSVMHATGERDMGRLGGLMKTLPATGLAFLAGSAAISGLPPFNGFAGEFLLFLGAFTGGTAARPAVALPALAAIAALALVGGLAPACFAKAFGMSFLGEPRRRPADAAAPAPHDPGAAMLLPMGLLAVTCLLAGICSPFLFRLIGPVLAQVAGPNVTWPAESFDHGETLLARVAGASAGLLLLGGLIAVIYRARLARAGSRAGVTWDCGYVRPTTRMQYTPSSFTQPIVELFRPFLRTRRDVVLPEGYFPARAEWKTANPDVSRAYLFTPAFQAIGRAVGRLRWLQQGRLQFYILYIALTLLALLLWKVK